MGTTVGLQKADREEIMADRLFSTYQVANLLGAAACEVSEWIQKGWLTSKNTTDGQVRITEKALVDFLKQRGVDLEALMAKVAIDEARNDGKATSPTQTNESVGRQQGQYAPQTPRKDEEDALAQIHPAASGDEPASVQKLAEAILRDAVNRRATHIHLDPAQEGLSLRMRIDGVIHDKVNFRMRLPKSLGPKLIDCFAALGQLPTAVAPAEGSFKSTIGGRKFTFRVATFPTVFGRKVVIQLAEPAEPVPALEEIGLDDADVNRLRRAIDRGYGAIVVVGPPRSGRTTLIEAMLTETATAGREIIAIETRRHIRSHSETIVHTRPADAGMSPAQALARASGQDADVIALADATDPATDLLSVTLEGRLIMAAMLADDLPSGLAMILENSPRWWAAAGLSAMINLRTVRRVCPACSVSDDADAEMISRAGFKPDDIDFKIRRAVGCPECFNTGYSGRVAIAGVMTMTDELRDMLRRGASVDDVLAAARNNGAATIRQAALSKLRREITTVDEIARALGKSH